MRKSFTWLACIALVTSVSAQESKHELVMEACKHLEAGAKSIMTGRQAGFAMSEMMDRTKAYPDFQNMVVEAYQRPRFSTEAMQARSVEDFQSEMYLECYTRLNERLKEANAESAKK